MRITSQLVLGYFLAIAAVAGFWGLSNWHSGTLEEDRDELAEEWAELDAIVGAVATLHHARTDPSAAGGFARQAKRVRSLAIESAETSAQHDQREARLFAELADILDEAVRADPAKLDGLADRAQDLTFSLWREDFGRVPERLNAIQPRRQRVRVVKVALSAVLLLLPLLALAYIHMRVVRPLGRIHGRIIAIGGRAPLPEPKQAALARLDRAVDIMGEAVEEHRRELEHQVETRTVQLRHADRLGGIGRIGAAVAHELNTPLGSIDLCLEGIRETLDDNREDRRAEVDRYLATARQQVAACTSTTRKLLSYAHLRPREEAQTSVAELVRDAEELVRSHAQKHGVSIQSENASLAAVVRGDVDQLRQVIVNLLLNAVDASPHGEAVTVASTQDGSTVRIAVQDHGEGVPGDLAEEVFNPFFTTKRSGEGTGLGLSISREIVESHGGRLVLDSTNTSGARFEVTLPIAKEADA